MNTTDRLTGTLDYAIRKRFAFVKILSNPTVIGEHYDKLGDIDLKKVSVELFNDIKLFITNPKHLCGDYGIDDLMIGHSYFMALSEEHLKNKVAYEIIPLINEYINDGILNVGNEEKKNAFSAWSNLQTISMIEDEEETDTED